LAYYVVDRTEGKVAIVVADEGNTLEVPLRDLPKGTREGTVLRIDASRARPPLWSNAVIDESERERRLKSARETINRLGDADPGGDVEL
jgi:hypothetical protein